MVVPPTIPKCSFQYWNQPTMGVILCMDQPKYWNTVKHSKTVLCTLNTHDCAQKNNTLEVLTSIKHAARCTLPSHASRSKRWDTEIVSRTNPENLDQVWMLFKSWIAHKSSTYLNELWEDPWTVSRHIIAPLAQGTWRTTTVKQQHEANCRSSVFAVVLRTRFWSSLLSLLHPIFSKYPARILYGIYWVHPG